MNWLIYTPPFDYTEPVLDDGSGPTYQVQDVIEVEAPNKKEAIRLGVKLMLADKTRYSWVHDQRSDKCSPYTGVKAELAFIEE